MVSFLGVEREEDATALFSSVRENLEGGADVVETVGRLIQDLKKKNTPRLRVDKVD